MLKGLIACVGLYIQRVYLQGFVCLRVRDTSGKGWRGKGWGRRRYDTQTETFLYETDLIHMVR